MDFVPVPIQAINGYDILVWVVGISALKALTKTPLKRGHSKRGTGTGVSRSERVKRAEVGMDSGGNSTEGDVRRRLVCAEDINTLYEGRFTRRAALLEKQKRDNANRIAAGCVSACSRALRETRNVGIKQEASQVKADRVATRTPAMGLNHEALTR